MDIWIMKGEKDAIIISTSIDKIKPCIYVIPQREEWIKISIPHEKENGVYCLGSPGSKEKWIKEEEEQ